jgi:hypothetical protein
LGCQTPKRCRSAGFLGVDAHVTGTPANEVQNADSKRQVINRSDGAVVIFSKGASSGRSPGQWGRVRVIAGNSPPHEDGLTWGCGADFVALPLRKDGVAEPRDGKRPEPLVAINRFICATLQRLLVSTSSLISTSHNSTLS